MENKTVNDLCKLAALFLASLFINSCNPDDTAFAPYGTTDAQAPIDTHVDAVRPSRSVYCGPQFGGKQWSLNTTSCPKNPRCVLCKVTVVGISYDISGCAISDLQNCCGKCEDLSGN